MHKRAILKRKGENKCVMQSMFSSSPYWPYRVWYLAKWRVSSQLASPKESHLAPTCLHLGKDNALPAKATTSNSGFSKVLSLWLQKRWDMLISECHRSCNVCVCVHVSRAQLLATLWTVLHQAPPSMEQVAISFFRDLPDPGIEPASLKSPALVGRFFTTSTTWGAPVFDVTICKKIKAQIMICNC